jgi:hypothetical protein
MHEFQWCTNQDIITLQSLLHLITYGLTRFRKNTDFEGFALREFDPFPMDLLGEFTSGRDDDGAETFLGGGF